MTTSTYGEAMERNDEDTLNVLSRKAHQNAVEKGFYDDGISQAMVDIDLAKMMLAVLDISNAAEVLRSQKGLPFHDRSYLSYITDAICTLTGPSPFTGNDKVVVRMLAKQMLIVTEVGEAAVATISDTPGDENLGEEIADIIIRCLDFAGANNIDIGKEVTEKMEKNRSRQHMHGKLA